MYTWQILLAYTRNCYKSIGKTKQPSFSKWAKHLDRCCKNGPSKCPISTWSDAQGKMVYSSEKFRLKQQWDITTHLPGWLKCKRLKILSIAENVELLDFSSTDGRNVNYYNHFGKLFGNVYNGIRMFTAVFFMSHELETIQMSINNRMSKYTLVYP